MPNGYNQPRRQKQLPPLQHTSRYSEEARYSRRAYDVTNEQDYISIEEEYGLEEPYTAYPQQQQQVQASRTRTQRLQRPPRQEPIERTTRQFTRPVPPPEQPVARPNISRRAVLIGVVGLVGVAMFQAAPGIIDLMRQGTSAFTSIEVVAGHYDNQYHPTILTADVIVTPAAAYVAFSENPGGNGKHLHGYQSEDLRSVYSDAELSHCTSQLTLERVNTHYQILLTITFSRPNFWSGARQAQFLFVDNGHGFFEPATQG